MTTLLSPDSGRTRTASPAQRPPLNPRVGHARYVPDRTANKGHSRPLRGHETGRPAGCTVPGAGSVPDRFAFPRVPPPLWGSLSSMTAGLPPRPGSPDHAQNRPGQPQDARSLHARAAAMADSLARMRERLAATADALARTEDQVAQLYEELSRTRTRDPERYERIAAEARRAAQRAREAARKYRDRD